MARDDTWYAELWPRYGQSEDAQAAAVSDIRYSFGMTKTLCADRK